MIKRVFFDIGDVLVHYQPKQFFDYLASKNRTEHPPHLFFYGDIFKAYEAGEINTGEFFDVMIKMFKLNPADYELICYLFGRVLKPDQNMITLKRNLMISKVKVGIISNNNPFHVAILQQEYPEVLEGMDVQIFSHKEGYRKPDPKIYQIALEKTEIRAEECLFIDDRLENVEAFRKLGGLGYHYVIRNSKLETDLDSVTVENNRLATFFDRMGLRNLKNHY